MTRFLYLGVILLGFGVLCKYIALILLPIFAFAIILTPNRKILLKKEIYLAFLIFLLVISIDIIWNINNQTTIGTSSANISDHIKRIGGIGLSRQPIVFYLRDFRNILYTHLGRDIFELAVEYQSMNSFIGAFYLLGIVYTSSLYLIGRIYPKVDILLQEKYSQFIIFLLIWFWSLFGFFLIIKPGTPKTGLDSVGWHWVDMTLFPAVIILAVLLSKFKGKLRYITYGLLILVTGYSLINIFTR